MSVTTEIQRLQDAKESIKESIIGKNVEVPENATLDEYSGLVDQIKTGNEITINDVFVKKSFGDYHVWTDGDNIYYSTYSTQYVLDKETSTWNKKTWNGLTSFNQLAVWTDGENIYHSSGSDQYVLDKETSTWNKKTWNGLSIFSGSSIWTDGENIYYSSGSSTHYVLDKETSTWTPKTWTGLTSFDGYYIWTDGNNIFYDNYPTGYYGYKLNKETGHWSHDGYQGSIDGSRVWTDGVNIYCSRTSYKHQMLDKSQGKWISTITFTGPVDTSWTFDNIWADGNDIILNYKEKCYKLKKGATQWVESDLYYVPATSSDTQFIYKDNTMHGMLTDVNLLYSPK